MTESMTILVQNDPAGEDVQETITIYAETFPSDVLDEMLHNITCETIAPYGSEEATELIDAALRETRQQVRTHLEILYETLDDTDADAFADLINDTKFRSHCLRASSTEFNDFELYDGTNYHYGTPVTTHETIEQIIENSNRDVYVARVFFDR